MLKKRIVFFEAEGGTDKWLDGHRRDTQPIIFALKLKGWDAEAIYYRDEWRDKVKEYVTNRFDAYVSRVNPGNLAEGEDQYFDLLRELSQEGMLGMPHPDTMIQFGAKDALVKLRDSALVPNDTYAYYNVDDFKKTFPISLSHGERVLKQNRGSTGSGIWHVSIEDKIDYKAGDSIPLDTKIKCVEAADNHVEYHTLSDFMNFCEQYIVGKNGMIVDMRFLHRIKEGEIRVLLVGESPVFVVHKKPAEGADSFSATLFSGAKYTYDRPEKWSKLISFFEESLPFISKQLGEQHTPLIWTADFMLDTDEDGNDKYVLGEINCSCVGFTSHLDEGIQEKVANEIIRRAENNLTSQ